MTSPSELSLSRVESQDQGFEAGMLEFQAQKAIDDLVQVYGLEHARMLIAFLLNSAAAKPARRQRQ